MGCASPTLLLRRSVPTVIAYTVGRAFLKLYVLYFTKICLTLLILKNIYL